jgi:hypothetical protein
MSRALRLLQLLEKILPESDYDWLIYDHDEPHEISRRGTLASLKRGDVFGLRQAHSDKNKIRLITKEHGTNKIFSIDHPTSQLLKNKSKDLETV